jgi:hypothetical protein
MPSQIPSVSGESGNTSDDYVPRKQGEDCPEPGPLDPSKHTLERNAATEPSLVDKARLKETPSASQCIMTLEKEPGCCIEACHIVPRGLDRDSVSTDHYCQTAT